MMASFAAAGMVAQAVAGKAVHSNLSCCSGEDILISISSNNAQVVGDDECVAEVSLGALYAGCKLTARKIDKAISRGLGGERDDQQIRGIKPSSSVRVLLHCFADERVVEVLEDFDYGRMKEHLKEEFSRIGIEAKGLKVEIENMEELRKIKEMIDQR